MPSGGQIGSGSGLRLQAAFPGTQDRGNANIDGTFRAALLTTTDPSLVNTNITGENIGHDNQTLNGSKQPHEVGGPVMVGVGNRNQYLGGQGKILFGKNNTGFGTNSVAFGLNNMTGNQPSYPDNVIAFGISNAVSTTGGTDTAPGAMAFGYGNTVNNQNMAFGNSNTAMSDNKVDHEVVVLGKNNYSTHLSGQNVALGRGINTNQTNVTIVGWYNSDQPVTPSNSVIIGRPSQTFVRIGPYVIGGSTGLTQSIADAGYNVTDSDGAVMFTSITAARVVNLPAANAVYAGYRILVVDMSGSASGVNTITITRAGVDTINGGATTTINLPYGGKELISDGISKWTIIRSI